MTDDVFTTARSRVEKDRMQKIAIEESLKGGFYGLVASGVMNATLNAFVPAWPRLHRTPRWIILIALPVAGFAINGENAMLQAEREYALKRSYVQDLEGLPGEIRDAMKAEATRTKISFDDVKSYVLDNRYKVVGLTWATVVGSVLVSTWANKSMPVAQKIITARVAAQASAFAGFVAFAAASTVPVNKDSQVDKLNKQYYERMISSDSSAEAAKWAEKWHEQLNKEHSEEMTERKQKIKERMELEAAKKEKQQALLHAHKTV